MTRSARGRPPRPNARGPIAGKSTPGLAAASQPVLTPAQLRQHQGAMRLLMEGAGEFAILMLDAKGCIVHWDKGAEQLVQFGADEVVGRHFSLFYTEADQRDGLPERALANAFANGRHNVDHWFVGKDGAGFWASNVVMPMTDVDGVLIGFAKIVRNITRRREEDAALTRAKEDAEAAARTAESLAAEVLAANRELLEANDSLQRFTSIVAHDLRAPLRRVETFVQFLGDDYGRTFDAGGQDIMARLVAGVVRIRLMLTALLEYSKCSSTASLGKTAALAHVVEAALLDLDLSPDAVDLSIDLGGVETLAGDAQLLSHVLHNLVGNAVKFARPGCRPVIAIKARTLGADQAEISVTDNGIGIEPQFADRVFEMLYRLHNDDEYEGTGIGLSVCRKIIRDHGGDIWIDPAMAGGTRVMFTLLTAPGGAARIEAESALV